MTVVTNLQNIEPSDIFERVFNCFDNTVLFLHRRGTQVAYHYTTTANAIERNSRAESVVCRLPYMYLCTSGCSHVNTL